MKRVVVKKPEPGSWSPLTKAFISPAYELAATLELLRAKMRDDMRTERAVYFNGAKPFNDSTSTLQNE